MPSNQHPHLPSLGVIDLGTDFNLNLDEFLLHPYDDIAAAAVDLPAIIEWVNQQLQGFIQQRNDKKQELKTAQAQAYVQLKNGGAEEKIPGKITDKAIDYLIELDDTVIQVNTEMSAILGWVSRLGTLLYVLQAKLDLVRSTESTRRQLITPVDLDHER